METKKCNCEENCETCDGFQPVDVEFSIHIDKWNKIENISVNRFLSEFEDEVILVIKTGFQDKFVTLLESAHDPNRSLEKIFEGTKIETEEKFKIVLD